MLLDFVKVAVIKYWSFRLTAILWPTPARRAEWNRRQSRQIELKRIQTNTKKMRKAFLVIIATNVLLSVTRKSKQLKQ